jgi:hypothetical protein
MVSKRAFRVIHVCPHSARLSGGHTNAIITFMESQLHHGMDVCGLCPADSKVPAALKRPIEHLPIREIDFNATDFCATALQPAAGAAQALFHFHGYVKPFKQAGGLHFVTGREMERCRFKEDPSWSITMSSASRTLRP